MTTPPATAAARVPRARRRAQLLDVTLALLAEEGFDALSIEAIARRAGVNRVIVYRSFANLEVLLVALMRRERARTERQLDAIIPAEPGDQHPKDVLGAALAGFLAAVEARPLTWRLALAPPASAPVALRTVIGRRRASLQRRVRPLVAWGLTRLDGPASALDEDAVSRMLISLAEEHGRLLLEDGRFTRQRLLSSAERVLDHLRWDRNREPPDRGRLRGRDRSGAPAMRRPATAAGVGRHPLLVGVPIPNDLDALTGLLSAAGFVAAGEEAEELLACGAADRELLASLVRRRLTGEPLAWVTGSVLFCGVEIRVDPGVYVPRWQSEPLARRAAERLPPDGVAVDLCTGSGAIAKAVRTARSGARVVASDVDERAVACATTNGVEVYRGDLFAALPRALAGRVDVVVGVVPYVPTPELSLLQRDTFAFESTLSYDGGRDGTAILRRVLIDGPRFLRRGGALLLELGGEQADALGDDLARLGYADVATLVDQDGDVRGVEATLGER